MLKLLAAITMVLSLLLLLQGQLHHLQCAQRADASTTHSLIGLLADTVSPLCRLLAGTHIPIGETLSFVKDTERTFSG